MAFRKRAYARRPARKARKARKPIPRKRIARVCKKVLTDMAEKKTVRFNWSKPIGPYGTQNWTTNAVYPITPYTGFADIAQGTGQANRVGNRITTRRLIFNGILNPEPYNATTNPNPAPLEVLMIIYRDKSDPLNFTTSLTNLYQNGNGASTPNGTLTDLIFPFNTDRYTIYYKRVFKLGYNAYLGTGQNAGAQNFTNNDFKLNCRFWVDCTKYVNKIMKFNDTANTPIIPVLQVAFLPMRADGGSVGVAVDGMCRVQANWQLDYFDV